MPPNYVINMAKENRIRIIAVTSARRLPELPDVPAIAEFVPGWSNSAWTGLVAAAKTPKPLLERWNREYLREVMAMPDIDSATTKINQYKYEPSTVEEFGELMQRESELFARMTQQLGIVREPM